MTFAPRHGRFLIAFSLGVAAGIAASANGGADEIKDAVIQRIERFREGLHALDDLTLLVLKRKVSSSEASQ